jgi:feruloyl-CoA synthase
MADGFAAIEHVEGVSAGAPWRDPLFAPVRVTWQRRPDGAILLESQNPMGPMAPDLIQPLERWAVEAPDRVWLAQRTPDADWQTLTFGEALTLVRRLGQAMLDLGLSAERPLMILSRNSIPHALMTYAAIHAGVPVCPVSPAYSLLAGDHTRLGAFIELVRPGALFAEPGGLYARTLAAIAGALPVIAAGGLPEGIQAHAWETLCTTAPRIGIDAARAAITPDTVAKYLLTSGSTGQPKAVINTHGMMCVNAAMTRGAYRLDVDPEPEVGISFLPWSHTFGGNAVLNGSLVNGGTLYIDWGAPIPGRFEESLRNLKDIAPTYHSTVPVGWAMIAAELERDPAFARRFFSRLRFMAYGGAAMSQEIHDRIQRLAVEATGHRIAFTTGYGATETAPTISYVGWITERMGLIGVPLPGVVLKLAPVNGKLEARVKGPAVTPGYLRDPERTAAAFDEEGFYRLGDAVRLVDPEDPSRGAVFDGRLVEDFKLDSGTFVSAGVLRVQVVSALGGLVQDAVVCGQDHREIGLLLFLNPVAAPRVAGTAGDLATLARDPRIIESVRAALIRHNAANPGSATRIGRALVLGDSPSPEGGELTDKGYINQAAARDKRAADVRRLLAPEPDADVIIP